MGWQNEMVIIVRHIVDDLDSANYTFSDSRLEETLLVSSQYLLNEMEFINDYQVEIDNLTLNPDPTMTSTKDYDFIALCTIQAGIILYSSLIKTYSLRSIVVSDGPSSIDMRGVIAGLTSMYKDLTKKFDDMRLMYQIGKYGFGKSILGPYSPGSDTANRGYIDYRAGFFA